MSPEVQEKIKMSELLEELEDTTVIAMVLKALSADERRKILAVLLRHEASSSEPMSYSELKKALNMPSNRLAYHLKLLRQAGLIEQLTDFALDNPTKDTGYWSFYETSPLATLVLRACLTMAK